MQIMDFKMICVLFLIDGCMLCLGDARDKGSVRPRPDIRTSRRFVGMSENVWLDDFKDHEAHDQFNLSDDWALFRE